MNSPIILETHALVREFRGFVAVNGVDLKVHRGEIHALIGPNGAGKTTVFNLLTKFLTPTSGRIVYNGVDITAEQPAQIARRGIVRSFQISATFPNLSVIENVRIALQRSRVDDGKDLDPQSLALRETREHITVATIVAAAANDSQFPCHGPCGTQPP